ncbi:MAG: hypothetical protein U5M50_00865 [Sphingobium sp.]|nr:hypothetical protein [Sphingobium sp.]
MTMTNSTPPFRADHVGSLLRPAAVTAARKAFFEEGLHFARGMTAIEDAGIVNGGQMANPLASRS